MELTDKLYHQIFSFVDGEMDAGEIESFETRMKADKELFTEVKLYKEIQALCESADKKIKNEILMQEPGKNSSEEQAWNMIAKARQDWESKNKENEYSGFKMGSTGSEQVAQKQSSKIINMQRWTMLAAAVALGIILFGGFWWYLQQKQGPLNIAVNPKEPNTQTVATNKSPNKANETSPKILDSTLQKQQPPSTDKTIQTINSQELFAASFKPDEAPKDKDASLDEPFNFYADKKYTDAVETFEMSKAALETRGEVEGATSTPFYIHYYLALSYMAAGSDTKKAIAELRAVNGMSPTNFLKSKTLWYLALAYLKEENFIETKPLLKQLAEDKNAGAYQQKAKDLLGKLLP